MQRWDSVAILGVGLIGGSIGLALRERGLAHEVVGIGRRPSSLRRARECGAVTRTTTSIARGVADAQLVIVCTPVEQIVAHVREAASSCSEGAVITDVGSTKAEIVRALEQDGAGTWGERIAFVGSHPLAGSEKRGPEAARADLFQNRLVVVTPTERTGAAARDAVEGFWASLGSRVLRISPGAHDEAVAATSHLPHLIASALAAATPEQHLPLVASGWLDTTRVAGGDAELWRQILSDNRAHVLESLDQFTRLLADFRQALERDDQRQLTQLLEAGKRHRDSVGS